MNIRRSRLLLMAAVVSICIGRSATAQTVTQRGFVEGRDTVFWHLVPNDQERQVLDVLYREEVFVKPSRWLQFAAGLDFRANTHDQVDTRWRLDFEDRTVLRPVQALSGFPALRRGQVGSDIHAAGNDAQPF